MQSCPEGRSRLGPTIVVCLLASVFAGSAVRAQAPPASPGPDDVAALRAEIAALRADYEQRMAALEQKLDALENAAPAPAAGAAQPQQAAEAPAASPSQQEAAANAGGEAPPAEAPATTAEAPPTETPAGEAATTVPVAELPPSELPPSEAPPTEAAAAAPAEGSTYFNPSISLIGNFLGVAGHNEVENLPSLDLRESELGLQAIVDPYARADVFISFGDEGGNVEEGYLTFTALPAGLLAKVGRIRAPFGKTNPLHLHVLPWADEPLPIQNLLGGEEGWAGDGVTISRLVPLPADTFSEATVAIFRGEREGLFQEDKRRDLAYDLRYRVFRDLTEATNLDLGVSWAQGPNAIDVAPGEPGSFLEHGTTRLAGFDATLRWKPLQTASYRSFTARAEAIRSRREQPGSDALSLGWFVSGEWQLAKRWFVGGRYEVADHADFDDLTDSGEAAVLTFWPSEFSQLRGELRHRRYELLERDSVDANELLLQLQFAIGAHGAHPF
ncbi:MAG TPA: hypothetical protein VGS57_06985 [Thermoanaerobaculia bacterium]|jgi:hypothetical protein|nr:hypothetical protein [Thermoanaerobaculia bacterium]